MVHLWREHLRPIALSSSLHRKVVHGQNLVGTTARASRKVYTENLNAAHWRCMKDSGILKDLFL